MIKINRFSYNFIPFSLMLMFSVSLSATNYYVATNGSDIANTGTLTSPFLTIQYGSNQLLPGDTLIIRGGSYFENVYLNNEGTSAMPITLMAYPGEVPIIDGAGTSNAQLLIINNKSHVLIDGVTFQNKYVQDAKGIYVYGEGEGIVIKNCEIKNIGWTNDVDADPYSVNPTGQAHGILINGRTTEGISDVVISHCKIHDIITGNSEALTLVGNVSDFDIGYTEIYDTRNIGIDVAGHYTWAVDSGVDPALNQSRNGAIHHCNVHGNRRFSNFDAPAGIYADGAKDVIIYNNVVYDNGNGFSIGCENAGSTASNITAVNNLVYSNDNQGIYFGSNASNITNCILKNNTFVENGTLGIFYTEVSLQNSTDCTIAQNILIPSVSSNYAISIFGYSVTNLVVDNNLAYRYGGNLTDIFIPGTPAQFTPTNTIYDNPSFVDSLIATLDISLMQESVAIDQGISSYSTFIDEDVLENTRIVNGKIDLGAAEAIDGDCPAVLTINDSYAIEGIFVAQDSVILDLNLEVVLDSIIIDCPSVRVISSSINSALLTIRGDGCVEE